MSMYLLAAALVMASYEPASGAQLSSLERTVLRGLNSASILVEELDADSRACNVGEDSLRLAAARPLVDARLKVHEESEVSST